MANGKQKGARHSTGDEPNDTASRMTHATHPGFEHTIPAKYVFGTKEEVGARVGGTIKGLPDRRPSSFRQLGPATPGGGGNMNDALPKNYSSARSTKFGSARRYS